MRAPFLVLLMLSTAFLAGCAEDAPKDEAAPEVPETQFESEVLQLSVPVMPRDPPAAGERTLSAAPQWRLGEWWTYEMQDGFTGGTYTFTRVVAGEDRAAGNYLVGFPVDAFSNDVMLFHVPGFGDITQKNLAYETHDSYFEALEFPLDQGNSWEVAFEGVATGLAEVASVSGNVAHIEMNVSQYGSILADYDAEMGEITEMTIGQDGSYVHYKVTGHGYDYKGTVRVPHAHDLVFIHGRLGPVAVGQSQSTAGPVATSITETVTIDPGYDRVSFILAVGGGAMTGLPATAGAFRETATAPDGTQYQVQWTPADIPTSGDLKIVAVGHEKPEGTWTLEHVSGGVGVAFIEGIGYHSIDIELPSGCVVASVNAMHHNANCKVDGQGAQVDGNATTAG